MRKFGGFTLIELLVVVSIIGLLVSIVMVAFSGVRVKARDTKRIADIQQINKAIQLYYLQENKYPLNTDNDSGGWDIGNIEMPPDAPLNYDKFLEPLKNKGLMDPVPREETFDIGVNSYRYFLYDFTSTSGTCGSKVYVLMAKLEKTQDNYGVRDTLVSCFVSEPSVETGMWDIITGNDWYAIMGKE